MAKFHKNLKKHADTVKKHEITLEELQFLKKFMTKMVVRLSTRLNTKTCIR